MKPDPGPKPHWVFVALFCAALVVAVAVLTSHPALRDETTIVTTMGVALEVKIDDGDAAFRISPYSPVYRIAEPDQAAAAALRHSEKSGNSLSLRVHLDGARFEEFSNTPEFWIESVEYLGKTYGPFRARIRWSWRGMGAGQAGLLRGLAFDDAWRREDAVKQLDVALDAGGLNDGQLALAYRTRGNARESLAYPPGRGINQRDDSLLMRAIDDYRRASQLDPSDFRAVHWQGAATASLGAYPEALALYDEVARRWPEQFFRVAIAKGATYRQMGDFDAALRELDMLVKAHGPQVGMVFHYHRGWTLNKLERYEEAAKDFTAGFETQPDYQWAFAARACAYAQQGDIAHAVDDQRRALELWDQTAKVIASMRADTQPRALLSGILQELEAALRTAPGTPSPAACVDLFNNPATSYRERSPEFKPG